MMGKEMCSDKRLRLVVFFRREVGRERISRGGTMEDIPGGKMMMIDDNDKSNVCSLIVRLYCRRECTGPTCHVVFLGFFGDSFPK